jgi:cytochrome c oxidase assembly factor CtaG
MTPMQFDVASMARNLATVMAVALVLGAGIPAIFALGMRATTLGRTVSADGHSEAGTMSLSGRVLSTLCFGLVLVAVVFGIAFIVAGKQIMGHL